MPDDKGNGIYGVFQISLLVATLISTDVSGSWALINFKCNGAEVNGLASHLAVVPFEKYEFFVWKRTENILTFSEKSAIIYIERRKGKKKKKTFLSILKSSLSSNLFL